MKRFLTFQLWPKLLFLFVVLTISCDINHSWDGSPLFSHGGDDPYTFEAGVYVITQNALDEAPYRYGSFLQQILRRMEKQKMPQVGFRFTIFCPNGVDT